MNTEKNQIEIEENQPVDKSRRRAIGAGIAAPVIMTLASKPVFAVQGLSNMLSTTGSAVNLAATKARGGNNFVGGFSHGYWKNAAQHSQAWADAGYTLNYNSITELYTSPILVSTVFGRNLEVSNSQTTNGMSLLQALEQNGSPACHIVSGFLNCKYFKDTYFLYKEFDNVFNRRTPLPKYYDDMSGSFDFKFAKLIEDKMDCGVSDLGLPLGADCKS